MRDFKGIKRQRNRNRNGGGGGGGGGKPQHNANRAFDSNGPDGVKVRGAAQHVYEKYQQLARDAHTAGDRVLAENHLQHAEHYFRVMRAMQPQRPLSDIVGRDQFVSGYDIDFEDESGQGEASEADGENGAQGEAERIDQRDDRGYRDTRPREEWRGDDRFDRSQNDRSQNDRVQSDRNQSDRSQSDRGQSDRVQSDRNQSDRNQSDRSQNDRSQNDRVDRSDRQFRGPRDDRFRDNRAGQGERPRFERQDRPDRDNGPERGEGRTASPYTAEGVDYRPPAVAPETGPLLRADDGEVSHAPAFLQVRGPDNEPGGEARRPPRRRRTPRESADVEAPAPETEES
jgi:Domain of unknown function (DUF4167)